MAILINLNSRIINPAPPARDGTLQALIDAGEAVDDAYAIGVMDADDGFESRPLHHFTRLDQIEAYIIGWKEAAASDRNFGSIEDDYEWIRGGC